MAAFSISGGIVAVGTGVKGTLCMNPVSGCQTAQLEEAREMRLSAYCRSSSASIIFLSKFYLKNKKVLKSYV